MADILLTHSNQVYSDPKQTAKMQPYPPLQTILAAAVLQQHGVEVALYDPALDPTPDGFVEALRRHKPRLLAICEDDFNFLSKMCLRRNREFALWMAGIAWDAGIEVVAHGSDASDNPAVYLHSGTKVVILGDVETALLELAQGRAYESIAGVAFECERGVHYTARCAPRADLDSLPVPAWDLVDMERYREAWRSTHGYFSLNMVSSRGCPYRCNWCAKPIFGSSYHVRSPQAVASEMAYLKNTFRPNHFWFADDIFALSPRWTRQFEQAVADMDASVPFKMQSRCDLMTRDTVMALRNAGCQEVWMGAESGSQKILDAMDKDIRVEEIYAACDNLRAHGIRACLFLQFGYPGEKWEDIEATIRMVRETAPDDVGISVSYPLVGTKFYQLVAGQIGSKTQWTDSADLDLMFRGEYSADFYRALADALHSEVRRGAKSGSAWELVHELRNTVSVHAAVT
jgi:radical SAM superfamily enzyme YgiQ (UPF0313 family)